MSRFAQGFWGFFTARSATAGRKRLVGSLVAWWAIFWAASVLSPCCDVLAAAAPYGHSLHSTAADDDANHAAGDHAPHLQCVTIGDLDITVSNAAPLLVAKLQLPEARWLPAAALVPAPTRPSEVFHTGYPQPPPRPRLYLRTSRLLI